MVKKHGIRTWEFGLYNAYNRANPFFVSNGTTYDPNTNTSKNTLMQSALFPIIPSVSYTFKFN